MALRATVALAIMVGLGLSNAHAVPTPIDISTTTVSFGAINVGNTSGAMAVTVTNTDPVNAFGPINIFGGAPNAPFNASQNCQGQTLAPGGTCTVLYTFSPVTPGPFNGSSNFTISATPNQAEGEDFAVVLSGSGVNPLTAAPLSHNFGNVNVGGVSAALTTVITNTSGQPFGPINIFGGAPLAPFNASQNCQGVTLPAGGTCTVSYTFSPAAPGTFNGSSNFTISATTSQAAGVDFSITLAGAGVNPITGAPLSHNFGDVSIGGTSGALITVITNTSGQPFGPLNIFGGAPPAPFNAAQSCQGVTLPAGGTCTISYTFSPTAAGTSNGSSNFTISATASQADGANFSITLTGCGVQPGQVCTVPAPITTPVPTLSEWALAMLVLLVLACTPAFVLRRRR